MVHCPYCGQECEYITAEQAAYLLGITGASVRRKIRQGLIPGAAFVKGIHKTGMWRIPITSILPLLGEES